MKKHYPVTPGGTIVTWLASDTADEAWAKLLADASHMPYKTKAEFKLRGYSVKQMDAALATDKPPMNYKFSDELQVFEQPMSALLIGPHERKQIAQLVAAAQEKPVNMVGITERLKLPKLKAAHMTQMTAQTIDIPAGFMVTFSFETGHPCGLCRHLSISRSNNRLPHPQAAFMIAQEFGFWGDDLTSLDGVWVENLKGHGDAVNLVQRVAH
jgi:hypothetical protein